MFKTRLISGIVLVLVAILTIRAGGWVLFATLGALAVIGIYELYRADGVFNAKRPGVLAIAGLVLGGGWYVLAGFGLEKYYVVYFALCMIVLMGIYVFTYPLYEAKQVMTAYFAILYVAVCLSCIGLTRALPGGRHAVWLIFLSAWGSDTCAYCVGMLIGKHKMAPNLSPKKSIEGAVGGIVGAVLLGILFAVLFKEPILEYALICLFGAPVAMIGDLAASAIKRNTGIKDFGKLIPGHGGVLDRFDSILFTAPMIYLLALLLIK